MPPVLTADGDVRDDFISRHIAMCSKPSAKEIDSDDETAKPAKDAELVRTHRKVLIVVERSNGWHLPMCRILGPT